MEFVFKASENGVEEKHGHNKKKKTANCWKGIFDTLRNRKVSKLNHDLSEKQNLRTNISPEFVHRFNSSQSFPSWVARQTHPSWRLVQLVPP